jgi:DNA-binding GntR family transcriptional regulator
VEEINNQNFGIKLFSEYVADPSAASTAEPGELQSALEKYPYCQLLHIFYSRSLAAQGSSENAEHFARTALLIPDRTILYTVLNNPEKLNSTAPILTDFIESQDNEESLKHEELAAQEDIVSINEAIVVEESFAEEILEDENHPEESIAEEIDNEENQSEEALIIEESADGEIIQEESNNNFSQLIEEEEISEEQPILTNPEPEIKDESEWSAKVEPQPVKEARVSQPVMNDSDLIENIFNQLIGAVPPPITPVAVYAVTTPFTDEDFLSEPKDLVSTDTSSLRNEKPPESKDEIIEIQVKEEAQIKVEEPLETIAEPQVETKTEEIVAPLNVPATESIIDPAKVKEADQNVSKYNDDKMPYSFLWWLNKTRNEHSDTYQPFVEFKLDTTQTIKRNSVDQLSSQIIENIFHLQSPLEAIENAPKTVPFQVRRKEDSILDKFIKEEPQIKPPNSQKLDTENKARKSAEDPNDLVSETLAQIYTDQMLFQKAIDTFKKLSLKFPEKSTYFADQIIELEKKVN